MASDLLYNGKTVTWKGKGTFKATSGLPGFQNTSNLCLKNKGPVPEGNYYVPLIIGGNAKDDGQGVCRIVPSWQIETIPRGAAAGACEPYWANWGKNRVRFEPADATTKNACSPRRGGFYLHDSTKGFSHGCIEIETRFFKVLRTFASARKAKSLRLIVKYQGTSTNGGTKIP
jgi:hypothetical protein